MDDMTKIINRMCVIKETEDVLNAEYIRLRDELKYMMDEEQIDVCRGDYGKATKLSFTRGTLNSDKTEKALIDSFHGIEDMVDIEKCKNFKDYNFVMIKRDKDTIIPVDGEDIK